MAPDCLLSVPRRGTFLSCSRALHPIAYPPQTTH